MNEIELHEAEVAARFDLLHRRFKPSNRVDDVRAEALRAALEPLGLRGLRVLDLGCGKGRFGSFLMSAGAQVVGLDISLAMLHHAKPALPERVLGSARRLPFAACAFDAVVAVEVFEHIHGRVINDVLIEVRRVLRPGGAVVIVDKNVASLNARRTWLPNLVLKWIDERRGLWMYITGGAARERWFWPRGFQSRLRGLFERVEIEHLLTPEEGENRLLRHVPAARLFAVWTARAPGGRA